MFHEHVKSYRLSFSDNGREWRDYKENGEVKVSNWSNIKRDTDYRQLA